MKQYRFGEYRQAFVEGKPLRATPLTYPEKRALSQLYFALALYMFLSILLLIFPVSLVGACIWAVYSALSAQF